MVTFKVIDSNGNAIPNVCIYIERFTLGHVTFYTDENGITTYDFDKLGLGSFTVDIVEAYKIKKSISYEISVEKLPAEYTLIWDFGNPNDITITPKSTATLVFQNENGQPAGLGYYVHGGYFQVGDKHGNGFDQMLQIGVINNEGILVWDNPPADTDVELIIKDDKKAYKYNIRTSAKQGDTQHTIIWEKLRAS